MGHLRSDRTLELIGKVQILLTQYNPEHLICYYSTVTLRTGKKNNIEQRAPSVNICSTGPFELVLIDCLHLDKSKGRYEYILVVFDQFTCFAQAHSTKSKSDFSAAQKIFNEFVFNCGFPKKLHHGRGEEFQNKLFQWFQELSNITPSPTAPCYPQGNNVSDSTRQS